MSKVCSVCGKEHNTSRGYCKVCNREYRKEYYYRNKDEGRCVMCLKKHQSKYVHCDACRKKINQRRIPDKLRPLVREREQWLLDNPSELDKVRKQIMEDIDA